MTPASVAREASRLLGAWPEALAWQTLKVAEDRVVLGAIWSERPDPSLIIKWSAHDGYAEHEAAFCAELGHPPGASHLIAVDEATHLVVMTRAAGQPAETQRLLRAPELDWLTSALAALHATPMRASMQGGRALVRHPWSVKARLRHVQQLGLITAKTAAATVTLANLLDTALDTLPAARVPIHGDVCAHNMLIDWQHQRIHLIDFEYATSGDAMVDLAFFATSIEPHFHQDDMWQRILSSYLKTTDALSTDEALTRFLLYQAYQRLFRHIAAREELIAGISTNLGSRKAQLDSDIKLLVERRIISENCESLLDSL